MFEWMAWTLPVAVFFTCIVLMLIGMTVWEIKSPTVMRKGFLAFHPRFLKDTGQLLEMLVQCQPRG